MLVFVHFFSIPNQDKTPKKKKKSILKANEKSFLKLKRGIKENNRKKQNLREVENKKPRNGKRAYIHFGRLWQYNARSQRRD
jgi:hypothetical protein